MLRKLAIPIKTNKSILLAIFFHMAITISLNIWKL